MVSERCDEQDREENVQSEPVTNLCGASEGSAKRSEEAAGCREFRRSSLHLLTALQGLCFL